MSLPHDVTRCWGFAHDGDARQMPRGTCPFANSCQRYQQFNADREAHPHGKPARLSYVATLMDKGGTCVSRIAAPEPEPNACA